MKILELESLNRQIEDTYKELLHLKQEELAQNDSNSHSGVIKVFPNNSDDLL